MSAQTFDQLTRDLEPNPDVIKAEGYQPEFKTAIWDYLAGLVDEERVEDGRAAMHENAQRFATRPSGASACRPPWSPPSGASNRTSGATSARSR